MPETGCRRAFRGDGSTWRPATAIDQLHREQSNLPEYVCNSVLRMPGQFYRRRVLKSSDIFGSYCRRCGNCVVVSPIEATLEIGEKMHKCVSAGPSAEAKAKRARRA